MMSQLEDNISYDLYRVRLPEQTMAQNRLTTDKAASVAASRSFGSSPFKPTGVTAGMLALEHTPMCSTAHPKQSQLVVQLRLDAKHRMYYGLP